MNLVIVGLENKMQELINRNPHANWIRLTTYEEAKNIQQAQAYFFLDNSCINKDFKFTNKPVFVNAVTETLKEHHQPKHVLRFNGWAGWLQKDKWEIAGQLTEEALAILSYLHIEPINLPDKAGFISAAVIALIINEAFYAEADAISSRNEIDTAMKLGTGYPYGPFEWAEKIGVDKIYELLKTLSKNDQSYLPADALLKEKNKIQWL